MKNKEAYKQAFKHVHYQKEINLNQRKIPKPLRLEWAFFLGENGRRQYNRLCKGCVHPCKQSFRAMVLSCPHYLSRRSKKCRN